MLKDYLYLFLISMVPLVELRGAMIYAAVQGMPFWASLLCCLAGNMLPVPFLIRFSKQVLTWLSKFDKIGWIFQKLIDRGNRKAEKIGGWELLGLFFFVALPIPGTGAWTASLVSAMLQLRMKKSVPVIALGVLVCGIIMGVISFGIASFV